MPIGHNDNAGNDNAGNDSAGTPAEAPLPAWRLLAYGALGFPISIATIPIILYLPAFYAQELHLGAGLVGLVFLLARLWDGVCDLGIAWLSDRTRSRFGRRKPWVVLGAPLLMATAWFLCVPPDDAGLAWLCLWAALFYIAYTGVLIPYVSWGTELATDYSQRSRISAFRESFTMIGNFFFAAAPLLLLPAGAPLRDVLLLMSIVLLATVPLATVPLTLFVPDRPPATRGESHLLQAIAALGKDRVLRHFSIAMMLKFISEGVINSVAVFSFGVGLGLPDKLFVVIFVLYVSVLAFIPVTVRLFRDAEKHRVYAGAAAIHATAIGALLFVPSGHLAIVLCLWLVVGVSVSALNILPPSMLADAIDHGEVKTGTRQAGSYVAIYNLLMKIGLALGVGISFRLLDLAGFDPSAKAHSAADAWHTRLIGFGLPIALTIPTILLWLRYPLTRQMHRELRDTIEARGGEQPILA